MVEVERRGRILVYSEGGINWQVKFRGRGGGSRMTPRFWAQTDGNLRVPLFEGGDI